MNKKQLIESLHKDIYCKIGVSKIEGVGVIAVRTIPKGTDPYNGSYSGNYLTISKKEYETLHPEIQKLIYEFFVEKNDGFLIPACGMNRIDISFYMNHSDNPNIFADEEKNIMYALRDIPAGEELTINYVEYCKEDPKDFK